MKEQKGTFNYEKAVVLLKKEEQKALDVKAEHGSMEYFLYREKAKNFHEALEIVKKCME